MTTVTHNQVGMCDPKLYAIAYEICQEYGLNRVGFAVFDEKVGPVIHRNLPYTLSEELYKKDPVTGDEVLNLKGSPVKNPDLKLIEEKALNLSSDVPFSVEYLFDKVMLMHYFEINDSSKRSNKAMLSLIYEPSDDEHQDIPGFNQTIRLFKENLETVCSELATELSNYCGAGGCI